ncbi:heterokaryon incompatibility protein het-E-1 [Fusarium circinatum]|uniref:Heterokaryon incompatibility protein het-E-1 n=1 Tax=Fusarium circinatum TaxID=48490 RepID=A0A8H5T8Z5_FUSCI|nr:heterokaryon incompatibility protein het-E-1 [Fusarium circinatum]
MNDIFKLLSANQKIYLLIDAADEAIEYKQLAIQVMSLACLKTDINILVTSRNEVAIQRVFTEVPRVCLEDHVSDIDQDIELYIKTWYQPNHNLEWLSPEVQNFVSGSLLSRSQGSFRWAACQFESLSHCRTVRDIRKSLSKLPEGLNETYGRLLLRTSALELPLVRKILTWLSFSSVPLKLHELWEALAIEQGRDDIDGEFRLRSPQDILILTNSLVTVSSEGYVMLAHLSVRDYLLSEDIRQNSETAKFALELRACHMEIAKDCLTYLSFSDLASGPSTTEQGYLRRLRDLPFISYASRYWFYHALHAENSEEVHRSCLDFFLPEARGNFMAWVQVFNATSPFKWNIYPRHATSLYYASSLGLNRVVDALVQSATADELNAPGSRFGGTAIHAAAIRGHLAIIRRLVSAGADPGKADFNGVTPLHSAAGQGSQATIQVLLDCSSSKEARDGMEGKTPAEWARLSGYLSAANLIEGYSQGSYQKAQRPFHKETRPGDSSKSDKGNLVEIWRPCAGYFPDYYERRSGLGSSLIISITLGETTDILNSTTPIMHDSETKAQSMVW